MICKIKRKIKPLSVNKVWQGKRFKTPTYKAYEQEWFYTLPKLKIPKGKLSLMIKWGFSSKASDIDNPTKPLLDILQKKWEFNDKMIYRLELDKVDVKKGEEFVEFHLMKLVAKGKKKYEKQNHSKIS